MNLDVPFNLFQEEYDVALLPSDRLAGFPKAVASPEDIRHVM